MTRKEQLRRVGFEFDKLDIHVREQVFKNLSKKSPPLPRNTFEQCLLLTHIPIVVCIEEVLK